MELLLIQITDIHLETEKDYEILMSRSNSVGSAIIKHITDSENTVIIICITGDIAYSGLEEQYLWASIFFDSIVSFINERFEKVFIQFVIIPGNHDCDFKSEDNIIRKTLLTSCNLDIMNQSIIKSCTSIQKQFFSFSKGWDKDINILTCLDNCILTINELNIRGTSIKFHCFNTAWCSQENEIKETIKIAIPDLGDKSENEILITLLHHDESWFKWDSIEVWKKYYKHYSDIIFIGHDHVSEIVLKDNYNAASNYYIKGNQLYNSKYPEQSGFNVLKINLANNIQRFFTYNWNGKLYENIIDSTAQPFIRNRYIKNGIELKKEIMNYINDIEMEITSKNKSIMTLSDIYVYPLLRGESLTSKKNRTIYKDKESILGFIKNKKYVSINGEKEFGKTALMKQLFFAFYEARLYPIFINIKEINTADGEELNKKIADIYDLEYNNIDKEEIIQMQSDKKVCIIDDFENINLSDKNCKKLLQYLLDKFGVVIITSNYQNDMLNFFKNIESREFIEEKFSKLTITELKDYVKRKLVDKWLLLSNPEQDVDSQMFDVLRRNKIAQIQSVMKIGYFNRTPIEFLLVLSYLDNYEKMNTDYSRYSYIYECLILDKLNEISNKDTNEATMYKTILEQLAYKMYQQNNGLYFDEEFILGVIFDYNQEYTGTKGEFINTVTNLVKYKILVRRDKQYKFKYSYMYYYFTGSYIKNQLSPKKREEKMIDIFSDLSKEINFNIALFLAYSLNTEYDILPLVLNACDSLLNDYKDFRYEQQNTLISKLNYNISEKVKIKFEIPKNTDIPEIQEKKALLNGTIEDMEDDDESKDELDKMTKEVFKTLRIIEFLGNILKNYSSSIKKTPRMEIISVINNSTMRIIGSLCSSIELMMDKIIKIIDEKLDSRDDKNLLIKGEFENEIKEFIGKLWLRFVEINVSNTAYTLHCDRIYQDVIEYKNQINSEFFDMVNVEFLIRTQDGKLPTKEIEDCFKGKNKLKSFSQQVLKDNIYMYLSNYQYDERDKQIVCSLLDFKIKDMLIEEQKLKAIQESIR